MQQQREQEIAVVLFSAPQILLALPLTPVTRTVKAVVLFSAPPILLALAGDAQGFEVLGNEKKGP
jgi:hypothetical protein